MPIRICSKHEEEPYSTGRWRMLETMFGRASSGQGFLVQRFLLLLFIAGGIGAAIVSGQQAGSDWTQFGWDWQGYSASTSPTGITAQNIASLSRLRGPFRRDCGSSAIYLHGVTVNGSKHDVFFMTTTYGKTIAVDANQGAVLWEYTPPSYESWVGSRQITNSTPVADPDRQHIYAAAPDGAIRNLAVSDGHVLWTTAITLLPVREKIASPLKVFRGHIFAVTGGYIGDHPYQGHVAILDAQTGKLLHVWNTLCSNCLACSTHPAATLNPRFGDALGQESMPLLAIFSWPLATAPMTVRRVGVTQSLSSTPTPPKCWATTPQQTMPS